MAAAGTAIVDEGAHAKDNRKARQDGAGALRIWWSRATIPAWTAHFYLKKKYTSSSFKGTII